MESRLDLCKDTLDRAPDKPSGEKSSFDAEMIDSGGKSSILLCGLEIEGKLKSPPALEAGLDMEPGGGMVGREFERARRCIALAGVSGLGRPGLSALSVPGRVGFFLGADPDVTLALALNSLAEVVEGKLKVCEEVAETVCVTSSGEGGAICLV